MRHRKRRVRAVMPACDRVDEVQDGLAWLRATVTTNLFVMLLGLMASDGRTFLLPVLSRAA